MASVEYGPHARVPYSMAGTWALAMKLRGRHLVAAQKKTGRMPPRPKPQSRAV